MKKLLSLLTGWDIGLALIFLLAAGVILAGYAAAPRGQGASVAVTRGGQFVAEYPLREDAEIELTWQGHRNLLLIREGAAYMAEANCPDGYCLRQGPVSQDRQTIVCLPARLVVSVRSDEGDELDAVSR